MLLRAAIVVSLLGAGAALAQRPTKAAPGAAAAGARASGPGGSEAELYLRSRAEAVRGEGALTHPALEKMIATREREVLRRRAEAIRLLQRYLTLEPPPHERSEAQFKLAEMFWEDSRVLFVRAMKQHQDLPAERQPAKAPRLDLGRSQGLYETILQENLPYPKYDTVLYLYAYSLLEHERLDVAIVQYRRILAEFPRSRFVPDAHMALAEDHFNSRFDYAAALVEYELVMSHPDSELYDIALFKSAWCLWRLNRSREAAVRFKEVLDLGLRRRQLAASQRRRLSSLQNEALNYLIQVFTEDEQNTAEDVHRFLTEIGGERYAAQVMRRLSEVFFDQARFERGIESYKLLLQIDPTNADAPVFQRQVARGYQVLGDHLSAARELEKLVVDYGPRGAWASAQGDPAQIERARSIAETALRAYGMEAHQEAQQDRAEAKYQAAADTYAFYLRHFPRSEQSYDIRFYLGEILFHRLHRYEEAGNAYLDAARQNKQGRFTKDALYNSITAFERVREATLGQRPQARQGEAAVAETENDRKFSEAIELYVELYPDDPDLPEIIFRQAKLYFDYGVFDPAVRLFGLILERFPEHRFAEPAGEMILDSFNRASDYGNIERWARRLKEAPAFASDEQQRRLDGLILGAMFKQGEQLAGQSKHRESAAAYLRAARAYPAEARAPQAYMNAGLEFSRAGDPDAAVESYDELVETAPQAAEAPVALWTAAQLYEAIAQFADAAAYYERYGERFPRGEKAEDALYNATLLHVTVRENDDAIRTGQRFREAFPRSQSVAEITFMMGLAHEQEGRFDDAAQVFAEYAERGRDLDRRIEAHTRAGQALVKLDRDDRAKRAFEGAVSLARKRGAKLTGGAYYGAQARYLTGELVFREYERVAFSGDVATLERTLQRKADLLARSAEIYADVVAFGSPEWATAALFRIGRSFEQFAESLKNAPVPETLSEADQEMYTQEVGLFAAQFEEKALEAYEGGYQKALQLGIYNRWTIELRRALERLNDSLYPRTREIRPRPTLAEPTAHVEPLLVMMRSIGAEDAQPAAAPAAPTPTAPAATPAPAGPGTTAAPSPGASR